MIEMVNILRNKTGEHDMFKVLVDPILMRFNEILIWFYKHIDELDKKRQSAVDELEVAQEDLIIEV